MKIRVPEEIGGGELKLLPEGPYTATYKECSVKNAKSSGQPMAWVRWVVTSEPEAGEEAFERDDLGEPFPTTGEIVLDGYSLQEQALWRLNDVHKALENKNIPSQDYEPEEFQAYLNELWAGREVRLILENEPSDKGDLRTKVSAVQPL